MDLPVEGDMVSAGDRFRGPEGILHCLGGIAGCGPSNTSSFHWCGLYRASSPRSVLCWKHLNAKELNPVWVGAGAVPSWTSCPPPQECPRFCPRCPGS